MGMREHLEPIGTALRGDLFRSIAAPACQSGFRMAAFRLMAEVLEQMEQPPLVLHPSPGMEMDDDEFFQFCQINRDLRIERTAKGDLIIMPPAGGSSGRGNAKLTYFFEDWALRDGSG